jgi:alkylated DNA nucleotide flippase Atl1
VEAKVLHLFKKEQKGQPVVPAKQLQITKHLGINGDVNSSKHNPRHILVTDKALLDHFEIKPGDLKENVVVKGIEIDKLNSGDKIMIGTCKLRTLFNCDPCGFVETIKPGLLKQIEYKRGTLFYALNDGTINPGDSIKVLEKNKYRHVPYKVFDRFLWLMDMIPEGRVVTYKHIIEGLGLFSAYYRVIPAYIKRIVKSEKQHEIPIHRIVDTNLQLITKYIPNQEALLNSEGVDIKDLEQGLLDLSDIYQK